MASDDHGETRDMFIIEFSNWIKYNTGKFFQLRVIYFSS